MSLENIKSIHITINENLPRDTMSKLFYIGFDLSKDSDSHLVLENPTTKDFEDLFAMADLLKNVQIQSSFHNYF